MYVLLSLAAQLFCQLLKFFVYSFRDKKINFEYFVTSGGFISSHSAFVSTLLMFLLLSEGFSSPLFSIVAVFAIIVIHDAIRFRGAVEKQSKILNRLIADLPAEKRESFTPLSETIGHNLVQVIIGILFGFLYALVMWFALIKSLVEH